MSAAEETEVENSQTIKNVYKGNINIWGRGKGINIADIGILVKMVSPIP